MKLIYTFILFFCFANANAQLVATPNIVNANPKVDEELVYDIKIKNTGNTKILFWWKLVKGSTIPREWSIFYCDNNLCYDSTTVMNPAKKPDTLQAGQEFTNMLHIDPNSFQGTGNFHIEFFGDAAKTQPLMSLDPKGVITTNTSAVIDQESKFVLSPNPTQNNFTISGIEDYTSIALYDMMGRRVLAFDKSNDHSYNIAGLSKGIYTVKIMSSASRVHRVRMMVKE